MAYHSSTPIPYIRIAPDTQVQLDRARLCSKSATRKLVRKPRMIGARGIHTPFVCSELPSSSYCTVVSEIVKEETCRIVRTTSLHLVGSERKHPMSILTTFESHVRVYLTAASVQFAGTLQLSIQKYDV